MHTLQPKHCKIKEQEVQDILKKYNLSLSQLPKIKKEDPALPKDMNIGDVVKIERKEGDKLNVYFRVVV
ncbi:DNA-directed RNA polymerase subunit H [Candidatus Woesearchaeota archaeon CG10_big_fil_rev_8_21_14_0_10_34_12]|nr:MAG: DNA-directed RNA polymerase subunit H [Candidatus Woesearchaeota archaeon CG10_big_fil_rev_8_21_14_0_10_34_12]